MIRRPHTSPSGTTCWALISQIEHARLAAELAAAWQFAPDQFGVPHSGPELVEAIRRHDDGWADWDQRPGIDPTTGYPRDFLEMPLTDALTIWQKSIDVAVGIGPLAGYVVSRHFSTLLKRGMQHWRPNELEKQRHATMYLHRQEVLQGRLTEQGIAESDLPDWRVFADCGLGWLQLFDGLSLWLCCRQRVDRHIVHPPDWGTMEFSPGRDGLIEVFPWPFRQPELQLQTTSRVVPARVYSSPAHLAATPGEIARLAWSLRPMVAENRTTKT